MEEEIALARDLVIIVFAGVFTLVLLMVGFWGFRLYRSVKKTAGNIEQASGILLHGIAPLRSVSAAIELANRAMGLVEQYRSRDRRSEDVNR